MRRTRAVDAALSLAEHLGSGMMAIMPWRGGTGKAPRDTGKIRYGLQPSGYARPEVRYCGTDGSRGAAEAAEGKGASGFRLPRLCGSA